MKIIITESQYKLLMEDLSDEGELYPIDFDVIMGASTEEKLIKGFNRFKKISDNFSGIKIIGDLELTSIFGDIIYTICKNVVEIDGNFRFVGRWGLDFPKLKRVTGDLRLGGSDCDLPELGFVGGALNLDSSRIKSLPKLREVGEGLYLRQCERLKDLSKLERVGGSLNLERTKVEELPNLNFVGGNLLLKLSNLGFNIRHMSEEERVEFMNKINVQGIVFFE